MTKKDVGTLQELNQRCQKPNYKTVGNWMVRKFLRDAALPCTRLILQYTNLSANHVTTIAFAIGLLAAFVLSQLGTVSFVGGVLFLQIWYYLDHVDGQLARYYGTSSLTGRFYDFLMHHVVHGVVMFSLGIYAFRQTESLFFIWAGFLGALAMMSFNMIHDIKYKAFFEKFTKEGNLRLKTPEEREPSVPENAGSRTKKIISLVHKSLEIHVMMNTLTLAACIQWLFSTVDLRGLFLGYYISAAIFLCVAKVTKIIINQGIDEEFEHLYRCDKQKDKAR